MIEIATKGNSTDFGDDNLVRQEGYAAFASPTRGVFGGGYISPGVNTKDIAYVTISSQGGVSDFGNLDMTQLDILENLSMGVLYSWCSSPIIFLAILPRCFFFFVK